MTNGEDPCQGIVDAIDSLHQQILDLESQLDGATGVERTVLQGAIRHAQQRIQDEQRALQRCRKNPPRLPPAAFVSVFAGTATVRTDSSEFPGPKTGPFQIPLTFSHDHRIFVVSNFTTKVGGITINQSGGGRGEVDAALGSVNLEIQFNVGLPIVGDATLTFFSPRQFTTEEVPPLGQFHPHGKRLDHSTAELTLAGASTASDNIIADGTKVEALLAGILTPLP